MKVTRRRWSVVTFPYWHYTFDYCLDSIAANGFENIEFWAASPQYSYADYSKEERIIRKKKICHMLDSRGLKMPVFYPEQSNKYPLNIASDTGNIREKSMQYLQEYIDDASDFGAGIMMIAPGHYSHDQANPDHYKRAVEALYLLCEYAKQYDISLAVEEWPAYMCTFASNLKQIKMLLKDVAQDNLKVCLNTNLAVENGSSVTDYINEFQDKLVHIHIADSGSRPLGVGNEAARNLEIIENSVYSGMLSLNIQFRDVCVEPDKPVFMSAQWLKKNGYFDI